MCRKTRANAGVIIVLLFVATTHMLVVAGCLERTENKGAEHEIKSHHHALDSDDWMLVLVNMDHPLPESFSPELRQLSNGLEFDARAIGELNAMLAAVRSQGLSPVIASAYRTPERQRELFNNKVQALMAQGLGREVAESQASHSIAFPGTSEHNLGLAVDVVSMSYQLLDENQARTPEIEWLMQNCSEYGFILRYPKGKEHITGVKHEPWHFRYVGVDAARIIMSSGMTLEEYLNR